jgi:phage-related minor tail protein
MRAVCVCAVALVAVSWGSGEARAQDNEWRDWSSARYYWDQDRDEMDRERLRNTQLRQELGLGWSEYQPETAMLTPARRGVGGAAPLVVAPVSAPPSLSPLSPSARPVGVAPVVNTGPDPRLEAQRRAEADQLRREEEARRLESDRALREQEDRRSRQQDAQQRAEAERQRKAEEAQLREEAERQRKLEGARQAEEERQRKLEEARLAEQDRQRRLEEAKQEALRKQKAEEEARRRREEEARRQQELLKEKTNDKGQVVDDELNELLDEAE